MQEGAMQNRGFAAILTSALVAVAPVLFMAFVEAAEAASTSEPPRANFKADPRKGAVPLAVRFIDTSSSSGAELVEFLWDFGDGTTSRERHPTHTYSTPGKFSVTLSVTDDRGAVGRKTARDSITAVARSAAAPPTLSDCVRENFNPDCVQKVLDANRADPTSAAKFLAGLPDEFKRHWIMMTRSEAVGQQQGTAIAPRLILPNQDAKVVFGFE